MRTNEYCRECEQFYNVEGYCEILHMRPQYCDRPREHNEDFLIYLVSKCKLVRDVVLTMFDIKRHEDILEDL